MKKHILALVTVVLALAIMAGGSVSAITIATEFKMESTKYEAEDGTIFGGIGINNDRGGASGGRFVSSFSEDNSGVKFETVSVPRTGYYAVAIGYANGDNEERQLTLYAGEDSATGVTATFHRCWGWEYWGNGVWDEAVVNLYLTAGDNTITLEKLPGQRGGINIDYISVSEKLITVDATDAVKNGGFESGNTENWTHSGDDSYGVDGGNSFNGSGKLWMFNGDNDVITEFTQTVTDITNGIYRISAAVRLEKGDQTTAYIEVSGYDEAGSVTRMPVEYKGEHNDIWEAMIGYINVSTGTLTVKIYGERNRTASLTIDDIILWKVIDKTGLYDLIAECDGLSENTYTAASWTTFAQAKTAASTVLDNASATQSDINGAVTSLTDAKNSLVEAGAETADYTAVNSAIASAEALAEADYTAASWSALQTAISAVEYDLPLAEQSTVDAYAADIQAALNGLIKKAVEMSISISNGMVTLAETENNFNITWNAEILPGADTTFDQINAEDITFKKYGVFYAKNGETLEDYQNAAPEQICELIFAQSEGNEDLVVYSQFGFRLKNVMINRTRAAFFYLEYEYEGNTYLVLSGIDEASTIVS